MVSFEHKGYDFCASYISIYIWIWFCYEFVALLAILVSKTARSWCSRTTRLEGSWISVVVVHCGPPLSKMEIWWPTVHCCQVAHEWRLKVRAHTIARYFECSSDGHKTAALTLLQEAYKNRPSSGTHTHIYSQHFKTGSMYAHEAGSTIVWIQNDYLSSELLQFEISVN